MKTIAKTTAEIIGKTPDHYETEIFNLWWTYCRSKSRNDAELQLMLINQPLNNWFIKELQTLEYMFKMDVKPYLDNSCPKEIYKIWKSAMLQIFTIYSFPLINSARAFKYPWKAQWN